MQLRRLLLLVIILVGVQSLAAQDWYAMSVGSVEGLQKKMEKLLRSGEQDSVLHLCIDYLEQQQRPSLRRAWVLLYQGKALLQKEEIPAAKAALKAAEQYFSPTNHTQGMAAVLACRGDLFFRRGRLRQADTLYQRACAQLTRLSDPTALHHEVLQQRAILYSGWGDHEQSMTFLRRALHVAQELSHPAQVESIYTQISSNFYSLGQVDSATQYMKDLIAYKRRVGSENDLISDLSMLGKLFAESGTNLRAQETLIRALRIAESKRDTFFMMSLCSDIAGLYVEQELWTDAFAYAKRAAGLARQKQVQLILADNLLREGLIHAQLDSNTLALQHYQEAFEQYRKLNNNMRMADAQLGIAKLYREQQATEQAYYYTREAIALRKNSSDQLGLLEAQLMLAELHVQNAAHQQALPLLRSCLQRASDLSNPALQRNCFQLLAEAQAALGHHAAAYRHYKAYTLLKDSISNLEKARAINELGIQYETELKDKALQAQQVELALQDSRLRRQQVQMIMLAIVLVFAVALLFFLYTNAQKNRLLGQQRLQVLRKNQEAQRLRAAMEGEERERRRVARDLHDSLGALLASVKMRINVLESELPALRKQHSYRKAEELIDDACRNVREISHAMVPRALEQQSLQEAIEDMCETLSLNQDLHISFIPFGLHRDLDNNIRITVYRILQELLRNVVNHAQATEAIVQLTAEDEYLNLIVEDNGVGLEQPSLTEAAGMGIRSIQERVNYLDGCLQVDSTAGQGTTFTIDLPIQDYHDKDTTR